VTARDAAATVAREWNERLAQSPDAEEQAANFAAAAAAEDITYGGRAVCSVFRPRFVSEQVMADLVRESELVISALDRAEAMILDDLDKWLPALGKFTDDELELANLPRRLARADISVRLDAVELAEGWRFFELNGAVPGGIEFTHELGRLFAATDIFADLSSDFKIRTLDLRAAVTSLLDAWRRWGGSGLPRVAIVDWLDDAPLLGEFQLLAEWLQAAGMSAVLADPRELGFRNGELRHESGRIDLVYRRLVVPDMVGRADECAGLIAAAHASAACFVDPIPQSTLDRKALFAFVTDPELDPGLSDAEKAACQRTVPWTRLLVSGNTTDATGEPIELLDYVRRNREHLVLKPNHDYGGRGLHLGWELDEAEWDDAIDEALSGEWVAQQAEPHNFDELYPTIEAPREPIAFHASTDPYLFSGGVGGVCTRLTHSGGANVTQGGAAVPMFVVAD